MDEDTQETITTVAATSTAAVVDLDLSAVPQAMIMNITGVVQEQNFDDSVILLQPRIDVVDLTTSPPQPSTSAGAGASGGLLKPKIEEPSSSEVCFVVRRKMESAPNITNPKQKYKKRTPWTDTTEEMLLEMWEDKILQLRRNRKNQHVYAEMAAELQKNGFPVSPLDVKNKVHNLTKRYRKEKVLVGPSGGSPSQWPLYPRLHCMLGSYKYYNVSEITCDSMLAPSAASTSAAAETILEIICTDESAASPPSTQIGTTASALPPTSPSTAPTSAFPPASPLPSPSSSIPAASPSSSIPAASPLPSPSLSIDDTPTPTLPEKKNKFQQQIIRQISEVVKKIDKQMEKNEEMDKKMYDLECRKAAILEKAAAKQGEVMDAILDYIKNKK